MKTQVKTIEQVRAEFRACGMTQSQWCVANGFSLNVMREVMNGRSLYVYGEAHRIAVALGLKEGQIMPVQQFLPTPCKLPRPERKERRSAERRGEERRSGKSALAEA
jgi:gp16 family phage-associated protein